MKIALLSSLFFAFLGNPSQEVNPISNKEKSCTIEIEIDHLESNAGTIRLQLLNTDKEAVREISAPIEDFSCSITFKDVPKGEYGIRYFHDANGNEELDTGRYGIPTEGYGFSNNARGMMGPPKFKETIFELKQNVHFELKTVY